MNRRSGGFCEARIPHVCLNQATSAHHRFKDGREWHPANMLDTCGDGTTGCHGWIEANPNEANARGLWLYAGEHYLVTPLIMNWRGIIDWYYLTNDGGIRWPGYPSESSLAAVT